MTTLALVALSVALVIAGCDREKSSPPPSQGAPPPPRSVTPPPAARDSLPPSSGAPSTPREGAMRDTDVTNQLRTLVGTDPAISDEARKVSITVTNGIVTLAGNVPTQTDKDIIAANAGALPAVIRVENKLEVVAPKLPG